MKIAFDFSRLKGRIVEKFGNNKNFANAMGWAPSAVTYRLRNAIRWKDSEIYEACEKLGIPLSEIPDYFFVRKF